MSIDDDIRRLETGVQRLEESLQQEVAFRRKTARYVTAVPVTLSVMLLAFFMINYINIRTEYTEENFSDSLRQEMREFNPAAVRELRSLGDVVLPVYFKEFREQFVSMGPEISKRFGEELDELSSDVLTRVHEHLAQTERRVLEKSEVAIFESYPELSDPGHREEITRNLQALTEDAVAGTIGNFERRFGKHVADVREALLKFDISDTGETRVDLQKKFIHLWLQLLDKEIMEL